MLFRSPANMSGYPTSMGTLAGQRTHDRYSRYISPMPGTVNTGHIALCVSPSVGEHAESYSKSEASYSNDVTVSPLRRIRGGHSCGWRRRTECI